MTDTTITTPTPEVNQSAATLNAAIDGAIKTAETMAETAIETQIEIAAPVFALPVLKQIEEEVVKIFTEKVGSEVSMSFQTIGTFIVIDAQISSEKAGISKELAAVLLAEKSGDANAIQKAIQDYQKYQSGLVNSDGSAHPST